MGIKLSKSQHRRAKMQISRMYLQGMTQMEIAENVKITQASVSRILSELKEDWHKEGVFNFDDARKNELAKINVVEIEAMEAWQRSIKLKSKKIKKTRSGITSGKGEQSEENQEIKWREAGDPRFLQIIQGCIDKRCQLLGLDSVKKVDLTSNGDALKVLVEYVDPKKDQDQDED